MQHALKLDYASTMACAGPPALPQPAPSQTILQFTLFLALTWPGRRRRSDPPAASSRWGSKQIGFGPTAEAPSWTQHSRKYVKSTWGGCSVQTTRCSSTVADGGGGSERRNGGPKLTSKNSLYVRKGAMHGPRGERRHVAGQERRALPVEVGHRRLRQRPLADRR